MTDKVAFIGLGNMGLPMARRLHDHGHELVVWNRTVAKISALSGPGIMVASSPAEAARDCPIVVSCLLDDLAVEVAYLGEDGVLAGVRRGAVLVEHGTFSPALARTVAEKAADAGAQFVDAPVTGGAVGAAAGTLLCMAGGVASAVDAVRSVVSQYCSAVEHVGEVGSGLQLKLINQMLVAAHALCAAEAAAMVKAMSLPSEVASRVLTGGWGSSRMLTRNLTPALTGEYLDEGADIDHLVQVLELVRAAALGARVPTVVEPVVRDQLRVAAERGLGSSDLSALVGLYDAVVD